MNKNKIHTIHNLGIRKEIGRSLKASSIDLIRAKWDIIKVMKSLWFKSKNSFKPKIVYRKIDIDRSMYFNCVFHNERTDSLILVKRNDGDDFYYCFWCGTSWSIIDLVMEITGKNIIQTLFYIKNVCRIKEKIEFENFEIIYELPPEMNHRQYLDYFQTCMPERENNYSEYIKYCNLTKSSIKEYYHEEEKIENNYIDYDIEMVKNNLDEQDEDEWYEFDFFWEYSYFDRWKKSNYDIYVKEMAENILKRGWEYTNP